MDLCTAKVALAQPGESWAVNRRIGQNETDCSALLQITLRPARPEQRGQVLLRRQDAADSQIHLLASQPQPRFHVRAEVPIGDPGRIAEQNIGPLLGSGKPEGARQISQDERPNAVAPAS